MTFLDFFQAIENSALGNTIRESNWAFAVIESVHLLALSVMGGSVLLVDMRMLGLGLTERPVRELAQNTFRYMTLALVVLIVTGIGLFFSEAIKCFYSTPFWVKMSSLFLATLFTYTIRRRVVMGPTEPAQGTARTVAILSLVLWFAVAASGRWIGFSG